MTSRGDENEDTCNLLSCIDLKWAQSMKLGNSLRREGRQRKEEDKDKEGSAANCKQPRTVPYPGKLPPLLVPGTSLKFSFLHWAQTWFYCIHVPFCQ